MYFEATCNLARQQQILPVRTSRTQAKSQYSIQLGVDSAVTMVIR